MLVQDSPKLLIGSVAKRSGFPVKTVRYYEEIGLLKLSDRTSGGFRVFADDVFSRLSFIKQAQCLGLSLAEIKEFLDIHDQGTLPCMQVRSKLQHKLTVIDEQIQQLILLKQQLETLLMVRESAAPAEAAICPIIESQKSS
jgi:DNA-binding transcriptional MerR regulator